MSKYWDLSKADMGQSVMVGRLGQSDPKLQFWQDFSSGAPFMQEPPLIISIDPLKDAALQLIH